VISGGNTVRKSNNKGQITVFLCIMLMALIILAGTIVDIARIVNGETQAKRAVLSAAKSALSGFDGVLKENYGIFALCCGDNLEIKSTVEDYLKRNLMISEDEGITGNEGIAGQLDIYGFKIENLDVTPILNLTENDTVRNQILQYMKYRAPKEIIEGIWDRLSVVREASNISEAYRMRYKVDKLLAKVDKVQQDLKKNIDGDGNADTFYVNGYNKNGVRQEMIYSLAEEAAYCCVLNKKLNDFLELKAELTNRMNNLDSDEEKGSLAESIAQLEESISHLQSQIDSTQRKRDKIILDLQEKHTRAFIQPNIDAEKNIKKLMEMAQEADNAINQLEKYMSEDFKVEGELTASFKSTCEADIRKLKELTAQGSGAGKILDHVVENIILLNADLAKLEQIKTMFRSEQDPERIKETILQMLGENLHEYNNNIIYDYERPAKQGDTADPRKDLQKNIGKVLKDDNNEDGEEEERDIIKSGIDMEQLPSGRKIESPSFDAEDLKYLKSIEYADNHMNTGGTVYCPDGAAYSGNLTDIDTEADFYDEQGMFAENAFGFLGSMGKMLGSGLSALRDEIYINEYIMGMFKNSVPVLKYDDREKEDVDLSGINKSLRETFFDSEVEYILHGNSSERINKLMTKAQILLIRFGMNTIHVYTDARKREFATAVATAGAGWWTG